VSLQGLSFPFSSSAYVSMQRQDGRGQVYFDSTSPLQVDPHLKAYSRSHGPATTRRSTSALSAHKNMDMPGPSPPSTCIRWLAVRAHEGGRIHEP
jgi:hypothetical protein